MHSYANLNFLLPYQASGNHENRFGMIIARHVICVVGSDVKRPQL